MRKGQIFMPIVEGTDVGQVENHNLHGIGAQPDFVYLKKNIGIDNREDLKRFMLEKTASMNFEDLARDVEPLLFDPRDKKKVLLFREFVNEF